MFAITSPDQLTIWDQLTIVVEQWQHLERAAQEDGPYIYSLTRTAMSKLDLEAAWHGALTRKWRWAP